MEKVEKEEKKKRRKEKEAAKFAARFAPQSRAPQRASARLGSGNKLRSKKISNPFLGNKPGRKKIKSASRARKKDALCRVEARASGERKSARRESRAGKGGGAGLGAARAAEIGRH